MQYRYIDDYSYILCVFEQFHFVLRSKFWSKARQFQISYSLDPCYLHPHPEYLPPPPCHLHSLIPAPAACQPALRVIYGPAAAGISDGGLNIL